MVNSVYYATSFEVDIKQVVMSVHSRDSGKCRQQIMSSLRKLSKTFIESHKQYICSDSQSIMKGKVKPNLSYDFSGYLLSFESLKINRNLKLKVH